MDIKLIPKIETWLQRTMKTILNSENNKLIKHYITIRFFWVIDFKVLI